MLHGTFAEKVTYMADFDKYAVLLRNLEGGFVDDPDDRGGATNCGVTLNTFRRHFGAASTVEDLRRMTYAQWKRIMKTGYWDVMKADGIMSQDLAEIMVDWCINSGTAVIRDIQTVAGVKPDGIVGPKTLAAINSARQKDLHERIRLARKHHYERIVAKNPRQSKFLKGWMNRLDKFIFSQ